jgi:hypothetical protein
MPTIVWILMWVVILGTLAFFTVREVRSGRKGPIEVERFKHQAVRDAGVRADMNGPNGPQSTLMG